MEFRELRSLLALSELGSITQAAERLGLSPAAIHKQLKILETELGVPLYEKAGRRLQLTQAADILLPYVRELLAQHDSAVSALEEWKGLKRGLVRIGTGPTPYVLTTILKRFRRANPGIEILIETGNTPVLLEGLRKGALDLALVVSPDLVEAREFVIEASWKFELVMVSSQRQAPRRCPLAELQGSRFILFRAGSRMQDPIDRYFAAHAFEPQVAMRFDNPEFIRTMVRAGLGIGILPLWVVERDVREERLTLIRQSEPPLYSADALLRRRSSYVSQPVEALLKTARDLDPAGLRLLTLAGRHRIHRK